MLASSSIVGFAALLASLQPIILQYSEAAGIIMATIGSLSAIMGMVTMVMTNVSKVVELAAAAQGIAAHVHAEIEEGKLVEVIEEVSSGQVVHGSSEDRYEDEPSGQNSKPSDRPDQPVPPFGDEQV